MKASKARQTVNTDRPSVLSQPASRWRAMPVTSRSPSTMPATAGNATTGKSLTR